LVVKNVVEQKSEVELRGENCTHALPDPDVTPSPENRYLATNETYQKFQRVEHMIWLAKVFGDVISFGAGQYLTLLPEKIRPHWPGLFHLCLFKLRHIISFQHKSDRWESRKRFILQ